MLRQYDEITQHVLADLQKELQSDLLGVLLVGSVAYGIPGPHSDIDLFAVIRPSWRQRRMFMVDDIEVEVFLNPVQQVRTEFQMFDAPSTISMFAQGRILSDPECVVQQLVQEAQHIWQQPRPAVNPAMYDRLRYVPLDLLKDAQDLLDVDEEAAIMVMMAALHVALDAYYKIHRLWPVPPKKQLQDIEAHNQELGQLIRSTLSYRLTIHERYNVLSAFIDRVLEPIGGRMNEWYTPRESV